MFYSKQQVLLIFLILYQHVRSHGSWTTRTTEPTTTILLLSQSKTPLVSSSEATLLTSPEIMLQLGNRMYRNVYDYTEDSFENNDIPTFTSSKINTTKSSQLPTTSVSNNKHQRNGILDGSYRIKAQRYKILSINTNCTRDLFEINIELNNNFRGILYAQDFPLECRARGNAQNSITLRLPTSGCGVRAEPHIDGSMELSVHVMLQMEEKLRQSSDILRKVCCTLPAAAMGMTLFLPSVAHRSRFGNRNARMRAVNINKGNTKNISNIEQKAQIVGFFNAKQNELYEQVNIPLKSANNQNERKEMFLTTPTVTTTITTPRVRIWLELGGSNGSGSVEVGVATTLAVRAIVPGTMGVRVVDCAALDGLGESTQQLLDERGCPLDEQVMPELNTHLKPAEEGWSKLNDDDLVEKTFTATFPAFKFPDRERLHVSCGVQLCKGKCPDVNCQTSDKLVLTTDMPLARIEVFNSLAVTAPQIEVDRLGYDRQRNASGEYSPYKRTIPTDGTLCLSVSKLALSFCILGLIFLLAIIVAICSLIRSKSRTTAMRNTYNHGTVGGCGGSNGSSSRGYRTEVCTSMFSSSSESVQSMRLGSKLLIPYCPNTLPYGRVY